jgi:hypothetical protein
LDILVPEARVVARGTDPSLILRLAGGRGY